MTGPAKRAFGTRLRRWLVLLAFGAALMPGCAAFRRERLEVPPGHQAVMGEIIIAGFGVPPHVVLEIAREDGSFRHELPVDAVRSTFVITLPPGRYVVQRLRINESGAAFPEEAWFRVGAEFTVGDTAVYVGTLGLERVVFNRQLRVTIQDEYERAVATLRTQYPELPSVVGRALMRPAA
jgi:hypothetical protein